MTAVASSDPAAVSARRYAWRIVALIAAMHFTGAAIVKYGLPSWAPRQVSEITIELAGSLPRGDGGTGVRQVSSPTKPDTKKSVKADELGTQKPIDDAKPSSTPSAVNSSAAGAQSAPTTDADYKAAYLNNPKPPYPPMAFQLRIEGTVRLKALVLPDGNCGEVLLAQSSGNELLDQSALNTVARWKFIPAQSQGKQVAQWVSIPISFTVKRR